MKTTHLLDKKSARSHHNLLMLCTFVLAAQRGMTDDEDYVRKNNNKRVATETAEIWQNIEQLETEVQKLKTPYQSIWVDKSQYTNLSSKYRQFWMDRQNSTEKEDSYEITSVVHHWHTNFEGSFFWCKA